MNQLVHGGLGLTKGSAGQPLGRPVHAKVQDGVGAEALRQPVVEGSILGGGGEGALKQPKGGCTPIHTLPSCTPLTTELPGTHMGTQLLAGG